MIIVSKATKRHCTDTVQSQGGRVRNVKQVSFEPGPEDSYGRCGSKYDKNLMHGNAQPDGHPLGG